MLNKEQHLYKQITDIAIKHDADKIILFGSRARKTNNSKSDIDLAVYGCNNFQALYFDLNENVDTLLEFDIIPIVLGRVEKVILAVYKYNLNI